MVWEPKEQASDAPFDVAATYSTLASWERLGLRAVPAAEVDRSGLGRFALETASSPRIAIGTTLIRLAADMPKPALGRAALILLDLVDSEGKPLLLSDDPVLAGTRIQSERRDQAGRPLGRGHQAMRKPASIEWKAQVDPPPVLIKRYSSRDGRRLQPGPEDLCRMALVLEWRTQYAAMLAAAREARARERERRTREGIERAESRRQMVALKEAELRAQREADAAVRTSRWVRLGSSVLGLGWLAVAIVLACRVDV